MKKKKFAYLFTIGTKIVWSGEDEDQLRRRMKGESQPVQDEVDEFIKHAQPGYHIQIPTGEFIFCTSAS